MLAHTASFLKLIGGAIDDTSRGVSSAHHFHNVCCGVEHITSHLNCDNALIEKADRLVRRAGDYITNHDLALSKTGEDAERPRAVHKALDDFWTAVERGQPNSSVRKLGLT
jgi:hypothetical protein